MASKQDRPPRHPVPPAPSQRVLDGVAKVVLEEAKPPARSPKPSGSGPNPSTAFDETLSKILSERLTELWAAHVFSEEAPLAPVGSYSWEWVLDPVDGTINAINGSPDYAVSVALRNRELPVAELAVVYLPNFHQLYAAQRTFGSTLNGASLAEYKDPSIRTASVGVNEHGRTSAKEIGSKIGDLIADGWILRQSGSAAIDICRVAGGVWTGFVELGLKTWDIAAADLIAKEAGCLTLSRPTSVDADWSEFSVDYIAARTQADLDNLAEVWFT